jgi:hypothetical protein
VSITSSTGAFSLTTTADTDATARAMAARSPRRRRRVDRRGRSDQLRQGHQHRLDPVECRHQRARRDDQLDDALGPRVRVAGIERRGRWRCSAIAGSVAINIVNIQTLAVIPTGASVDAHDANVSVAAASDSTTSTTALPAEGTTGVSGAGSVGVGASVAIAIMDDVTTAAIDGTLTGGANLSVTATTTNGMFTDAKTGASARKTASRPVSRS